MRITEFLVGATLVSAAEHQASDCSTCCRKRHDEMYASTSVRMKLQVPLDTPFRHVLGPLHHQLPLGVPLLFLETPPPPRGPRGQGLSPLLPPCRLHGQSRRLPCRCRLRCHCSLANNVDFFFASLLMLFLFSAAWVFFVDLFYRCCRGFRCRCQRWWCNA